MPEFMLQILRRFRGWWICALAFVSAVALYLFLFNYPSASGKMVIWFAIFVGLVLLIRKSFTVVDKRIKQVSFVFALLFSLFTIIGDALHRTLSLSEYCYSFSAILKCCFFVTGFAILYYTLLLLLLDLVMKLDFSNRVKEFACFTDNHRSFLLVWAVIFLCWIPYFLVYYPGLFSYDSVLQIKQATGEWPITAHHPLIHTGIIAACMKFGEIFGSLEVGTATYSILQMLAMSAIFAFVIRYLTKIRVRYVIRLLILLYFALFPINALYSITMWKDVLFGGITLALFILLFETLRSPETLFASKRHLIILSVFIVLFCLFRNNALYALVLFTPVIFIVCRKYWRSLAAVSLACIVVVGAFNITAFSILKIPQGSIVESLSVPLQQLARTVRDHPYELTEQEKTAINEILPIDQVGAAYSARLSDPVKNLFNKEAFSANKGKYISLWAKLFVKHPKTYVESFLCNNYGYWYPDVDFITSANGFTGDLEVPFQPRSLLPIQPQSIEKYNRELLPVIPVFSMLYSIGFMVWILIISVGIFILKRQKRLIVPFVLLGTLWLTNLASPVFAEYRYMFGIVISAPVALALALGTPRREPDAEGKPL